MLTLYRSLIVGLLYPLVFLCLTSTASAIPPLEYLKHRSNSNSCPLNDVVPIIKLLSKYPAVSNQVCGKLLNQHFPKPITIIKSTTLNKPTTIWTTVGTTTIKKGTSIIVAPSTTTAQPTATARVTSTSLTTTTSTIFDRTVTSTKWTTTSTSTRTITTITATVATLVVQPPAAPGNGGGEAAAPEGRKRATRPCLREEYPELPREFQNIALDVATRACDCFWKPLPAKTVTTTWTVTSRPTVTSKTTQSKTVPVTTTRSTKVTTKVASATTTTVTDHTTVTKSEMVTAVTTTTTTSISTPVATETQVVTNRYDQVSLPSSDCWYSHQDTVIDVLDVSNNPDSDYEEGMQECVRLCEAEQTCRFVWFFRYDASQNNGYDAAGCVRDTELFSPARLSCGGVGQVARAYNKFSSSQSAGNEGAGNEGVRSLGGDD